MTPDELLDLLREARESIRDLLAEYAAKTLKAKFIETERELLDRIDAALAMAVQVSGELCEKCGWAMKFPGEPCRCELLAKVERLHADPLPAAAWVREVERAAFKRGAEAMREAVVGTIRAEMTRGSFIPANVTVSINTINTIPDPKDEL